MTYKSIDQRSEVSENVSIGELPAIRKCSTNYSMNSINTPSVSCFTATPADKVIYCADIALTRCPEAVVHCIYVSYQLSKSINIV